jgi:hypothetical protein
LPKKNKKKKEELGGNNRKEKEVQFQEDHPRHPNEQIPIHLEEECYLYQGQPLKNSSNNDNIHMLASDEGKTKTRNRMIIYVSSQVDSKTFLTWTSPENLLTPRNSSIAK